MLAAGQLRTPIVFEIKTATRGKMGAVKPEWTTAFQDRAVLEIVGTREFQASWKRNSESNVRFRVRYRSVLANDPADVADSYRIVIVISESPEKLRIFNIFPPYDPDSRRRELVIEAQEVQ